MQPVAEILFSRRQGSCQHRSATRRKKLNGFVVEREKECQDCMTSPQYPRVTCRSTGATVAEFSFGLVLDPFAAGCGEGAIFVNPQTPFLPNRRERTLIPPFPGKRWGKGGDEEGRSGEIQPFGFRLSESSRHLSSLEERGKGGVQYGGSTANGPTEQDP